MQLFYSTHILHGIAHFDEEESRHLLSVLRHKPGDVLRLTDGKGFYYDAELIEGSKKQALARILREEPEPESLRSRLHIAIAPGKHMERFEWFLEKAGEIGIGAVTPLLCERSERNQVRHDRLEKILVSAMKQSLRATLPVLHQLTAFKDLVSKSAETTRCIAWCEDDTPRVDLRTMLKPGLDTLVLIGPTGDFTAAEVALARAHGFAPVTLGETRLRTETAGLVVAVMAMGGQAPSSSI